MWVESQGSDMDGLASSLLGDDLKGFAGGGQDDRHTGEVLLKTDQRHINVLGRDLHGTADATGALAAISVVPLPPKGSKTISPSCV